MKELFTESDIPITIVKLALQEDIRGGDITSNAIFTGTEVSEAHIISKDTGVFCGGMVLKAVYAEIDHEITISLIIEDGSSVKKSDTIANISGSTRNILLGERTALNFIQRMSGIATKTRNICSRLGDSDIRILDTRKTLPGFRLIDKYSVKTGGGRNHRFGLFDMVMIKDNHIKAAGSIAEAVRRIKDSYGRKFKIEVETKDLIQVKEALSADVDIIMLDNMSREAIQEAIEIINGKAKVEVSGNISEENIEDFVDLHIDYISIGALTHSVTAFDLSMRFL